MDEKVTSAAYVIGLYRDIEALNDNLSDYKNMLVEINPAQNNAVVMSEEQKARLKNVIPNIRFLVIRTNIKVCALQRKIKEFETFAIEKKNVYENIIDKPVPLFNDLFEYVVGLNQSFLTGISPDFFSKVTQIYSDYSNANNYPTEEDDATTKEFE